MPRVIVSAGHTSNSPGSIANGMREVDLSKQIAKATLKYLRQNGLISLSVPPEMDLLQRIEWINKTGYAEATNDVAIEVHINEGGKSGIEIWFEADGGNKSQQFADAVLNGATTESKLPSQGSKSEYQHELGSIAFVHDISPIACLIECGYIDNPSDAQFLKDPANLDMLGKGIAKGVLQYYNLDFREFTPAAQPQYQPPPQTIPQQPMTTQPAMAQAQMSQPVAYNSMPAAQFGGQVNQSTYASAPQNVQPQVTTFPPANTAPVVQQPKPVMPSYQPPPQPVNNYPAPNYNQGPTNYAPPTTPTTSPMSSTPGPVMTRDQRKDMISKNYVKILGREPNQNDLNYFLNIGIKEDELIRKMIDSQEHVDLVKARQEVITIKQKQIEQQSELEHLRALTTDQQNIINTQNSAIYQKNLGLNHLQYKLNLLLQSQNQTPQENTKTKDAKSQYKGTFLDRIFKMFSDIFE